MTTIYPNSSGQELAGNGSENPKMRNSLLANANSFIKPAEQANEVREKEADGSISPTSESSESTTSVSQASKKVFNSRE